MEKQDLGTLDEIRQFCSDWICEHLGKEYDTTPWMDKWRLFGIYAEIGEYEKRQTMDTATYIKQREEDNGIINSIFYH